MNTFLRNLIFFAIGLIITVLVLANLPISYKYYEILKDGLVGILSSLLLLIIIEVRDYFRDHFDYGYLAGKYKRECRYNEILNNPNTRWQQVFTQDIPDIKLIYKGNREYFIPEIHYDLQWIARATIFLNETGRKSGAGTYQYHHKANSIREDFGTYELFVDEFDNGRLYIFHQNYLPSGKSAGYEIFVKQ